MSETPTLPPQGSWKVRARSEAWSDGQEVVIFKGDNIVRLTFEPFERYSYISEPTVRDHGGFLQDGNVSFLRAALNAAWDLGLRPDGFLDVRESMKATTAHLEDMRALAFHKIGAQKP
jgi:hypothetical protein